MSLPNEIIASFGITEGDQDFFSSRKKPLEDVLQELKSLSHQQIYPKTISPALIKNGLIKRLSISELISLEKDFSSHWLNKRNFELFIPSAGAATRQLLLLRTILNHPLLQGLNTPKQLIDRATTSIESHKSELKLLETAAAVDVSSNKKKPDSLRADIKVLQEVVDYAMRFWQEGIVEGRFAFLPELATQLKSSKNLELSDVINERNLRVVAEVIVSTEGLNYGQLPKLLMRIHSYNLGEGRSDARLTFEEHLREAASLLRGGKELRLHFPISEEHRYLVDTALAEILQKEDLLFFLERHGFSTRETQITFSYQNQLTDSVSLLASTKQLARDEDGKPLLRKAGHGTLLSNLSRLKSDSIWINNVDNVLYDNPHIKRIVLLYKKAMASLGLSLERKLHEFVREAESKRGALQTSKQSGASSADAQGISDFIDRALLFLEVELQTKIVRDFLQCVDEAGQLDILIDLLKRPVLIAGFVPLEPGQAGGGPFALEVELARGVVATKVNIVEQSEFKDGANDPNFKAGEFFNPVMLFIARKAPDESVYQLDNLSEPSRFFRSEKTDPLGQVLLAYERPGLWNGGIVKAFQVNIALPSCVFAAIKDIAGKESPLSKLHQPYSGPAITELDELRGVVDDELKRYLEQ